MKIFIVCVMILWIVSITVTVYDKIAAKRGASRISEKNLLLLGLAGGALVMYCTMRLIRHKTRHAKFMILLPLEVILHIALLMAYFYLA